MRSFSDIRLKPWREIAIIMVSLMEISWITPWFRSLTPQTYAIGAIRVLITFAATVLISYILVRSMDYLLLKRSVKRSFVLIFLVLGSFVDIKALLYPNQSVSLATLLSSPIRGFTDNTTLIPVEFIVIIAVLICFWRGLTLAQEYIGPSAVLAHFWMGMVMFIAFVFLVTIVTGETSGDFFFLFLFSTLVGIASARMAVVGMLRGGAENKFNRSWFIGIVIIALVLTGVAMSLGILLSEKFSWIGALLLGLFSSLLILVWVVVNPLASYMITVLGKIIKDTKMIDGLGNNLNKLNELVRGLSIKISGMLGLDAFLSRWGPSIKTVVLVVITALFVFGIMYWLAFKLWKDRDRRLSGTDEKSDLTPKNFLQSIMDMLHRGFTRAASSLEQLADFRRRRRIRAATRIRQIYSELMDLCTELEHPRPDTMTPLEFEPKIKSIFPTHSLEVSMITHAYLAVRYGMLPETESEVGLIENAWKKISSIGRELLSSKN